MLSGYLELGCSRLTVGLNVVRCELGHQGDDMHDDLRGWVSRLRGDTGSQIQAVRD